MILTAVLLRNYYIYKHQLEMLMTQCTLTHISCPWVEYSLLPAFRMNSFFCNKFIEDIPSSKEKENFWLSTILEIFILYNPFSLSEIQGCLSGLILSTMDIKKVL